MAYVTGTAKSIYELMEKANTLLTSIGWEEHYKITTTVDGNTVLYNCIYKSTNEVDDEIFLQMRTDLVTNEKIYLDSITGIDELLLPWEQPGSISQWLQVDNKNEMKNQPILSLAYGEIFHYWMFANKTRFVVVARESIDYESAYMGFILPMQSDRQYSYPVYIGGNCLSSSKYPKTYGSFLNTSSNSFLRRPDGQWTQFDSVLPKSSVLQSCFFPYYCNNKHLVTVQDDEKYGEQNHWLVYPIIIPMDNSSRMCGELDGIVWISGAKDLFTEDMLILGDSTYLVFDSKRYRDTDSYFAIKM